MTTPRNDLDRSVRLRRQRRERARREGERSLAQNLAWIGVLGWLVVTPTLAGIFVGRWLDRRFGQGIAFTLGLLCLGLTVGCALAWKRIGRP